MSFIDHVDELLFKELNMFVTGLVGAALDGYIALRGSPRWCGESDGYAPVLVQHQEAPGRVINVVEAGKVAAGVAMLNEGIPSFPFQKLNVSAN